MNETIQKMNNLIQKLNEASDAYYNSGHPIMSDAEFDTLLDELAALEQKTGYVRSDSPTHRVGASVMKNLTTVAHGHPMLSLAKVHTNDEIAKFVDKRPAMTSIKLDGLSMSLRYEDGTLVRAETRGNGMEGTDVTEHAKQFLNVPLQINKSGVYVIDGEAIIKIDDFERINQNGEYANPRNLASGTLAQLDTSVVRPRCMRFYAWRVVEGSTYNTYDERFKEAAELGFDVVPHRLVQTHDWEGANNGMSHEAEVRHLPCDGVVWTYNDIAYGESLGATDKSPRYGIAFKFANNTVLTHLTGIDWSIGHTGKMTPVALFEPVDIDGSRISRASLANINIMKSLELGIGDEIVVSKHNLIIPAVDDNLTRSNTCTVPEVCPYCGQPLKLMAVGNSTQRDLWCFNVNCAGKKLEKFERFCSKECMNVKGISEATLEVLLKRGVISEYVDIYTKIEQEKARISNWEGFGAKSVNQMVTAINSSRHTTLARFINALGINGIGKAQAKILALKFGTVDKFIQACASDYDFSLLANFGKLTSDAIHSWYNITYSDERIGELIKQLDFEDGVMLVASKLTRLNNKSFCITGKLNHYSNRDALVAQIEALGGKCASGVTSKTDYLINNDIASTSGKNKKAKELGVQIITEDDFNRMAGIAS